MSNKPPTQAYGPVINRIADVMAHTPYYQFKGTGRLAADARVDGSTISRLIHGQINPSFLLVTRVTSALEFRMGMKLDPRDLVAENGEFLTNFVCDLAACRGCLPVNALDEFGDRKAAFLDVKKGEWVTSRYPKGYLLTKGGL
jgi:hypothetical protein